MACHEKQVIKTDKAPAAIGPYSVATGGGPFIFTAGQLGIDPQTGELVEGGVEVQTRQAFKNLESILKAANSCLKNAVKTTVYLRDMADFAQMNAVYAEFFEGDFPARTTVAVAGLPKNALVEIEMISMLCQEDCCH
jgi:2-iminobutanoate/2-iminopropanoate deaminase